MNLYKRTHSPEFEELDPWLKLATAVILQAMMDWLDANKHHNIPKMRYLENWFRSDTFEIYSMGMSGEKILYRLKRKGEKNGTGKTV